MLLTLLYAVLSIIAGTGGKIHLCPPAVTITFLVIAYFITKPQQMNQTVQIIGAAAVMVIVLRADWLIRAGSLLRKYLGLLAKAFNKKQIEVSEETKQKDEVYNLDKAETKSARDKGLPFFALHPDERIRKMCYNFMKEQSSVMPQETMPQDSYRVIAYVTVPASDNWRWLGLFDGCV